jgi:Spy/CpxP family protein refolding chaperone
MSRIIVIAATLALVAMSQNAVAQTAEQQAACSADFRKLCPGVMPGGGRILDCLAKQKDKLSPACKKVVADQGR